MESTKLLFSDVYLFNSHSLFFSKWLYSSLKLLPILPLQAAHSFLSALLVVLHCRPASEESVIHHRLGCWAILKFPLLTTLVHYAFCFYFAYLNLFSLIYSFYIQSYPLPRLFLFHPPSWSSCHLLYVSLRCGQEDGATQAQSITVCGKWVNSAEAAEAWKKGDKGWEGGGQAVFCACAVGNVLKQQWTIHWEHIEGQGSPG